VRVRTAVSVLLAIALVAGIGAFIALRTAGDHLPGPRMGRACTVNADGQVALDGTQMANAATIAAVGIRRGLPEQAVVVALATALQESKLENLAGGDRDSVGLFQQRPSQGWGTVDEIRDPRYSSGRFYSALLRVRGWEQMRVTEAAQRVQRSAYPEAYQKWASQAEVLAKALLGHATGAVACAFPGEPAVRGDAAAAALVQFLQLDWGDVRTTAAQWPGLALSVRDTRNGWQYAHWLVSHAAEHGVKRVRYDRLEWTAKGGAWSRVSNAGDSPASVDRVIAEVYTG
jgi:hypothetical protein